MATQLMGEGWERRGGGGNWGGNREAWKVATNEA